MRTKDDIDRRLEEIKASRPVGSGPADRILARAVELYSRGDIAPRDLRGRLARLESVLRDDMPDIVVARAPATASSKPARVALTVTEPRVLDSEGHRTVGAESHTVVLAPDRVLFASGILPGGTNRHLFERFARRSGRIPSLAHVMTGLSRLWPTLLWMRSRQRRQGRGEPLSAIVTPFQDGLLFAAIQKVEGMPGSGTISAVVDAHGTRKRDLRDWYADNGDRIWVATKTYVGVDKLRPGQIELRTRLEGFAREYSDVVEDGDWKWRIGFGQADPAVEAAAAAYRLVAPSTDRIEAAYDALEAIVTSDLWIEEQRRNALNQLRSQDRPIGTGAAQRSKLPSSDPVSAPA